MSKPKLSHLFYSRHVEERFVSAYLHWRQDFIAGLNPQILTDYKEVPDGYYLRDLYKRKARKGLLPTKPNKLYKQFYDKNI